nr:hypothetical protein [Actinokineospora inagensis]
MTVELSSELPSFPMTRGCPHHPPSGCAGLRADGPISRVRLGDGRAVWAVTDHALARELLVDTRLSSDRLRSDFPVLVPRMAAAKLIPLVGMDPPVHTRHRRMLIPSFTLPQADRLRPEIERIVAEDIDIAGVGIHTGDGVYLPAVAANRTASTSAGTRAPTWRSATASTSASGRTWPAPSWRSRCAGCWAASPPWPWPNRSPTFR